MKKIYVLILLLLACASAFSQSLSPVLIGSTGDETDNATYLTSWSIGEAVIETASAGSFILTQGFQQGFPSPTITSGQTYICANSGSYTYTTQAGMTGYVWTVPPGNTITSGAGTYQVQVMWATPGPQTISVNYINVYGYKTPNPATMNVIVNPMPSAAGTISGTSNVCAGTSNTLIYWVAPVPNALYYNWSLPNGATIINGAGSNTIWVNFAANAVSGNITVYGTNYCGSGTVSPAFHLAVSNTPLPAGTITGPSSVCKGEQGLLYTVPVITNATTYLWTLPAGATIVSGSGTDTIIVNFADNAQSGNITVCGSNSVCGFGAVSPNFAVTVNSIPATPVITANGYTLHSSAPAGNQWYRNGTAVSGATQQTYIVPAANPGFYWTIVTLNGCSSDPSNHVYIAGVGVQENEALNFNVYPVPSDGLFTAEVSSAYQDAYHILIYNSYGEMVYRTKEFNVSGTHKEIIDIRNLSSGIYLVVVTNDQKEVVRRILINR